MTELDAFIHRDSTDDTDDETSQDVLSVVTFSFGGARYVLAAEQAVCIIPMRPLTRLPGAHAGFAGAIQDRGRVIALLAHPLAVPGTHPAGVRVIVCSGARGLIGLPVASLDGLQELRIVGAPEHGSLLPQGGQAYTFIDARVLGGTCLEAAHG